MRILRTHSRFVSVVIVAALSLVFVTALRPVHAADNGPGQNVTLTPASSSPSVPPGDSTSSSVNILNGADSSYNVKIYSTPYYVEGANYDPHFTQLPGTTDASQWVQLGKTSATIDPHKLVSIPYTLHVPDGTAPGGYYAVIFVETQPDSSGEGVKIRSRVGSILYITVQGDVQQTGDVTPMNLPMIITGSSIPVGVQVKNTGGVHFLSSAKMSVTNIFGKKVLNAQLERYVLPQTVRDISTPWNHMAPIGVYRVHREATVFGQTKIMPDRWVVVVHPITLIILLVIAGLLLIWVGTKLYLRRKAKK